ncbi:phosphoribosyltransferase [Desertibacillus haloalkaliphilus]|uniref:phosphoribosyltransferase n=1 Tax=Desertibacillus haloalkaliphilus TaxID=1328930 RepID=UPI001C25D915|nr:phosphoribosyltransferase [Desertibacillus haloalkaliphilus]MBU8908145.1 phosphoribosyltransferase [Desertibacillus haloalkaliphilus]
MEKNVVLTRLTVFNESFQMYDGIKELFESLNSEGHNLIVISHDQQSIAIMQRFFQKNFQFDVRCEFRRFIRVIVDETNAKDYILVGSSNDDLVLAANKRMLIINPGWSVKQDEKPARYGITLNTPFQLLEAIRLIANQNKWYFKLEVPDATQVLALTSANTMNRDVEYTERQILDGFEGLLKAGDRKYFNTLYFHLISGVMKNPELRNVELWGTFPTSSGTVNEELEELKERCRYLTGRRMTEPLFIRHTKVEKSRNTSPDTRLNQGCKKHFDSVILNPYYNSSRIRGKVVCVLDDYLTNGISFESARNLLLQAGARKVILLALGRYRRGSQGVYQQEVYNLTGRINKPGYNYELVSRRNLVGTYDPEARDEVNRIYEILNG